MSQRLTPHDILVKPEERQMRAWEVQVFIWQTNYGDRKYEFRMFQPDKPNHHDINHLVKHLNYSDGRIKIGYVRETPLEYIKVSELNARELLDLLK